MLPRGVGFAALLFGVSAIAASVGASAQERRFGPGAPAARPAAPPAAMARPAAPPAMARPAAPPAMARPAAPAFRATAAPQHRPWRPASAAYSPHRRARLRHTSRRHGLKSIGRAAAASDGRPSTPHIAAPRARATPRPAIGRRGRSRRNARNSVNNTSCSDCRSLSSGSARCFPARLRERQRAASIACSSACSNCSRKSRKARGRNASSNACCNAEPPTPARAAQQQTDLARQQRLADSLQLRERQLLPPPCRPPNAGGLPHASVAMTTRKPASALTARENGWAPRHAWQRGHRAAFVAWLGPVFWPYAYSDIFEYTFWPYGYDPGYWAYAYDDFVDTVFWGADSPYSAYASVSPEGGGASTGYNFARANAQREPADAAAIVRRSGQGRHRLADCVDHARGAADARAARLAGRIEDRGGKGGRRVQAILRRYLCDDAARPPAGDDEPHQRDARGGADRAAGTGEVL